ncbi:unnamed protein product [Paramecium octaurelia]|uniref:C2H2-type domain-containing protein n=1 Tax=Paramecium octaurelia TaxID=43137 RepID=A0A8S1X3N1_PAROT|nr:unnamed protein product [Paramecium octaurelia]
MENQIQQQISQQSVYKLLSSKQIITMISYMNSHPNNEYLEYTNYSSEEFYLNWQSLDQLYQINSQEHQTFLAFDQEKSQHVAGQLDLNLYDYNQQDNENQDNNHQDNEIQDDNPQDNLELADNPQDNLEQGQRYKCDFCDVYFSQPCKKGGHTSKWHKGQSIKYREKMVKKEARQQITNLNEKLKLIAFYALFL